MFSNEYLRLFHLPTTSCLIAFVIIGSCLASKISLDHLVVFATAIFFGGGIAANFFDELQGRPWHTTISRSRLWIIGIISLAIFISEGVYLSVSSNPFYVLFFMLQALFAVAYGLESFNGLFHRPSFLGISWGSVALMAFLIQNENPSAAIMLTSIMLGLASWFGIRMYEEGKSHAKDCGNSPSSREAWGYLQGTILSINLIALVMLAYRYVTAAS